MTDVKIYRRHSAKCSHKKDGVDWTKCDCRIWFQYQVNGSQVQVSADTRDWEIAKGNARKIEDGITPIAEKTITSAAHDWLVFRERNGLTNEKPTLMMKRLIAWCGENGVTTLDQLTPATVIKFRSSLPYKGKTSTSFQIHWGVVSGFFGWCHGSKLIAENPVPDTKLFPQFKIKVTKPEVVPPTAKEIERVIELAKAHPEAGLLLFVLTMRHSGMAIQDTVSLSRDKMTGNLIRGNRMKTKERYRVRIPEWLADAILATGSKYPFWDGVATTRVMAMRWGHHLRKLFKDAKVKMSSHGFRHFFISQALAQGVRVDDVSKMVGTSPREIRKTYEHWVKEAEDRLDDVQEKIWLQEGLDKNGNQPTVN
jgi:integrase